MTPPVPKPPRKKAARGVMPRVSHHGYSVPVESVPLEETEQLTVVGWLEAHRVLYHASPNGGLRHKTVANRMKAMGCKPGFPDIAIFKRPPMFPANVGTAIELKRREGGKVSKEQAEWLNSLRGQGWIAEVCCGCDEAIALLESLGYGGVTGQKSSAYQLINNRAVFPGGVSCRKK